ncbi:MAG: hypothetical protein LUI02_04360 [Clostridiales bacterium]|nr:hypothetical protein [Clostridiales bacterium]
MCGIGENAGATHMSIALSNFLSGKFCKNTAYLEMNASHEIFSLSGKSGEESTFCLQRVDYHPAMTISSEQEMLSRRYRYFVLDFGKLNTYTTAEFLHCDRKLAIGCVSPWKQAQFQKFYGKLSHSKNLEKEGILYIGNYMGTEGDLRKLEKRLGTRVMPMPFIPDPFHVDSANFTFFEDVLR